MVPSDLSSTLFQIGGNVVFITTLCTALSSDLSSAISAVTDIAKASQSVEKSSDLLALLPADLHDLLQYTKHNFRKSFMHKRDEILRDCLKANVKELHDAKTEKLVCDGVATFENTNVYLEFSRCSASLAEERIKTKLRRLAPIAESNKADHCVIVLTKPEGQILEEGSFKFFEEYGKQVAHSRYTRERPDENPLDRVDDETFAKVQANRLRTMVRAISRTLQTRSLDIFVR